jgi:ribonuclease Z
VIAHYPASGQHWFDNLRDATAYHQRIEVREQPITGDGVLAAAPPFALEARRLDHPVEAYGYRLTEPDGRRMVPELLARHGVAGPDVGRLQRAGSVAVDGRVVRLEQVSEPRPGQRFAFVMDTRLCDAVGELARDVDLLVIESTFLDRDAALAREYGHLTAAQAGAVAAGAGVRTLVLTHFSQRYRDPNAYAEEAGAHFGGEIVVAEDLARVPVPPRRG